MRRILRFEALQTRELFAADLVPAAESESAVEYCNSGAGRLRIDGDGCTVPSIIAAKVQSIVDTLNANETQEGIDGTQSIAGFDVNRDEHVTPHDAILLINLLNSSRMPASEIVDNPLNEDTSTILESGYFEIESGIGVGVPNSFFEISGSFEADISPAGITFKSVDVAFTPLFDHQEPFPILSTLPVGTASRVDDKFIQDVFHCKEDGYCEIFRVSIDSGVLSLHVAGQWSGGRYDIYNYTLTAKQRD